MAIESILQFCGNVFSEDIVHNIMFAIIYNTLSCDKFSGYPQGHLPSNFCPSVALHWLS